METAGLVVTHDLLRIASVSIGEVYTERNITVTPTLYLTRHIKEDYAYVNN